jgi:hypothetical protein
MGPAYSGNIGVQAVERRPQIADEHNVALGGALELCRQPHRLAAIVPEYFSRLPS